MLTRIRVSAALATLFMLAGCERQGAAVVKRPPGVVPVCDLATPEDAAGSALLSLQAELRAFANDDRKTAAAAFDQLRYLIDDTAVRNMLSAMPQYKSLLGEDLIKGYIENWGAVVGYYIEGLHLDQMYRLSSSPAAVQIIVPASGAEDDALLQITCNLNEDDGWRVARIEFAAPSVAETPPAPTPESQAAAP